MQTTIAVLNPEHGGPAPALPPRRTGPYTQPPHACLRNIHARCSLAAPHRRETPDAGASLSTSTSSCVVAGVSFVIRAGCRRI